MEKVKKPTFLNLDEAAKKEILDHINESDLIENDRLATIEFMKFGDNLCESLAA